MDLLMKTFGVFGVAIFGAYWYHRWFVAGPSCDCTERIDEKVVIVTGATSGIGRKIAEELALRGGRVYLGCRNIILAEQVAYGIRCKTGNIAVRSLPLDLNSFASIRNFVSSFKECEDQLDILVNNAGVFHSPSQITGDGFDVTFQTNYLGQFLLTVLLVDLLCVSGASRVVGVSSEAHRHCKQLRFDVVGRSFAVASTFSSHVAQYAQAKLAFTIFHRHLSQRLRGTGVTVNCVDPGNVNTEVYRHCCVLNYLPVRLLRLITQKTVSEGIQTVLHTIVSSSLHSVTGLYYSYCTSVTPSSEVHNVELAKKLWELSMRWTGLEPL